MAALTVTDASNGLQDMRTSMVAANGGGDTIAGGSRAGCWDLGVVLVVANADTTAKTVTVRGVSYVVPANNGLAIIPVYATQYGQVVAITYSAVTAVTVGAFRLHAAV